MAVGVPESVRQLIDQQLAQVHPEVQAIMEAASVAGIEFSAAAVAAAVDQTVEDVEACCDALARQGHLCAQGLGEWPDGTAATRYGFLHSLYPEVLYERVPVSRRARWHRQIGTRLEAGYGVRARELAAELAMHFARGRDMVRAVRYLHSAGEQALQRSAHQEAMAHFTHALTLLPILPETPERTEQELQVHMALGPALIATKGYADPDVGHTYSRARSYASKSARCPTSSRYYLALVVPFSGSCRRAHHEAEEFLRLVNRQQAPALFLEAHGILGITLIYLGECAMARRYLEQSLAPIIPRSIVPLPSSWTGPWRRVFILCSLGLVVAWVSRPGPPEEPRGAQPRPGAVSPV